MSGGPLVHPRHSTNLAESHPVYCSRGRAASLASGDAGGMAWRIAKQVLTALGKNFQDYNYLYPIPQGEIDKSGGSITQNPGY